jgi:hypothetical protein
MPVDAVTRTVLDRRLPEFAFDAVPLADALTFLKDVTGGNFVVDWDALVAAGVERTRPVSFRLRDLPVRTNLWLLLRAAQAKSDGPLDFAVTNGAINISTAEALGNGARPATNPATP